MKPAIGKSSTGSQDGLEACATPTPGITGWKPVLLFPIAAALTCGTPFACAGALVASWPVLRWFVARLGDGGDERFGLVALALALALTPRAAWRGRVEAWRLLAAGACVLAAALGGQAGVPLFASLPSLPLPFPALPMLPLPLPILARALLCAGALAFLICRGGGTLGRAGLLALALPVVESLQFFAGYPLRVLTAEAGRPLIALCGVATRRAGVALQWAGGQVVVDAPCSGVHMLWTGGVLVCALAAWLRLGAWRTLALGAAGAAAVLAANAARAAALFFVESGLWGAVRGRAWVHEGVGLVVFAALAAGVLWLGARLKGVAGGTASVSSVACAAEGRAKPPAEPFALVHEAAASNGKRLSRRLRPTFVGIGIFVIACAAAAVLPLAGGHAKIQIGGGGGGGASAFPGWPETFEGRPWIRLAKPAGGRAGAGVGVAGFASGFAGETGVFRQATGAGNGGAGADADGNSGERIVVLRWIREASRGVHPAADCFRASGYKVKPAGLVRDANGVVWSEFFAERGGGNAGVSGANASDNGAGASGRGESWRVRERWRDERGGVWTDVSAWYWSALRGGGPWWAETVAERCGERP